jgi:hypothetical protein
MNDNTKTLSRVALEASCLKTLQATEVWDPLPLLRGIMKEVGLDPAFEGDYKDAIASLSARLAERIWEYEVRSRTSAERRAYARVKEEASRRGLLNGYDCPRATSVAWKAMEE